MQQFFAVESDFELGLSELAFIPLKSMLYKDFELLEKLVDRTCE
jgi:hypothetical protein